MTFMKTTSRFQQPDYPALLRTWAALKPTGERPMAIRSSWSAANRLVAAAREKLRCEAERLERLLQASRQKLRPLQDPFDLDLGLHRWLAADREEAYSDWLQWVIQQIRTPSKILDLFGLPQVSGIDERDLALDVQREVAIP